VRTTSFRSAVEAEPSGLSRCRAADSNAMNRPGIVAGAKPNPLRGSKLLVRSFGGIDETSQVVTSSSRKEPVTDL
jgi:hypothetical protein